MLPTVSKFQPLSLLQPLHSHFLHSFPHKCRAQGHHFHTQGTSLQRAKRGSQGRQYPADIPHSAIVRDIKTQMVKSCPGWNFSVFESTVWLNLDKSSPTRSLDIKIATRWIWFFYISSTIGIEIPRQVKGLPYLSHSIFRISYGEYYQDISFTRNLPYNSFYWNSSSFSVTTDNIIDLFKI